MTPHSILTQEIASFTSFVLMVINHEFRNLIDNVTSYLYRHGILKAVRTWNGF